MYDGHAVPLPSLYAEWLPDLKVVVEKITRHEAEMSTLARNFAIRIPHCQLALYAKVAPARLGRGPKARPNPFFTGRPRGLYWGRVTRTHVVIHRKGRLNGGMIWKIALRGSKKHLFWAFERQRLYLNRSRSRVVKIREDLRKVLILFTARPLPVPFASLVGNLAPLGARDYPIIHGLYNLALDAQHVPDEMAALVAAFRGRFAGRRRPPVSLLRWTVNSRYDNRRLYFSFGRSHVLPERLTKVHLRPFKFDRETLTYFLELRAEAAALNRRESLVRERVLRIRRLFRLARLEVRARHRPPRRRAPA